MEGSKENYQWDLGSVGVDVNFRALEKSIWVLEKSSGNLFLKKGTNPVSSREEKLQDGDPIQVSSHCINTTVTRRNELLPPADNAF